jgi:hypothetical protein
MTPGKAQPRPLDRQAQRQRDENYRLFKIHSRKAHEQGRAAPRKFDPDAFYDTPVDDDWVV